MEGSVVTEWISSSLVSTDWLRCELDNPKLRVFEVSIDPDVYADGHIPGAVNLNWSTDLVDMKNSNIASRDKLQETLRAAGVQSDTLLVIYGDHNNWFAVWVAWVLGVYGLGDQVRILDGGRGLWEAEGLPLTADVPSFKRSTITLSERGNTLRARLSDVLDVTEGRSSGSLVDIRLPDEYSDRVFAPEGVKDLSIRAGHVPGAANVPWSILVNDNDTFKSTEGIHRIYVDKEIGGSKAVIPYCRIGERSSHSWSALKRIFWFDARNCGGSWTEYGNAVDVSVDNPTGTIWTGK